MHDKQVIQLLLRELAQIGAWPDTFIDAWLRAGLARLRGVGTLLDRLGAEYPAAELVTIGWNPATGKWGWQTGDNFYQGDAYGYPVWAVGYVGDPPEDFQEELLEQATQNPDIALGIVLENWDHNGILSWLFHQLADRNLRAQLSPDAQVAADTAFERGLL